MTEPKNDGRGNRNPVHGRDGAVSYMIIWERNVRDHPRGKRGPRLVTSTVPAETEKVRICTTREV